MGTEINWRNVREYMKQREEEERVRERDAQKGRMRARAASLRNVSPAK